MTIKRLLIANRGEIAIRIIHACRDLDITSIAIYSPVDSLCQHVVLANESYQLNVNESNPAVGPYLDIDNIISICKQHNIDAIHPGYGFLSENAVLALQCELNNIQFIGPSSKLIEMLGHKINCKHIVQQCNIPTVPGSSSALHTYNDIVNCVQTLQFPILLKSTNGGGGKGIRFVYNMSELEESYNTCVNESIQSFGSTSIFVEQLIQQPKHIEVQILADQYNNIISLGERDCSAQVNNQKIIEISNAPNLSVQLKQQLIADSIKICQHIKYINACTVEYLVDTINKKYYFLEINPRIQVEHCVTEQTTGVDIVQTQIHIANGLSLKQLNLSSIDLTASHRLYSIQARVNITAPGKLQVYNVPTHKDIRIDDYAYNNYTVLPFFDSLLCKVIATGTSYQQAYSRLYHALCAMKILGVQTNINTLLNVIDTNEFHSNTIYCTYIQQHQSQLDQPNKRLQHLQSAFKLSATQSQSAQKKNEPVIPGTHIRSTLSALVNEVNVNVNDTVYVGDVIAVVSAMKMQTTVKSHVTGCIKHIYVKPNQLVEQDDILVTIDCAGIDQSTVSANKRINRLTTHVTQQHDGWSSHMNQIKYRQQLIHSGDPNGMTRQQQAGKLHVRQRIDLLLDQDSFRELGSIAAGSTKYNKADPTKLDSLIAANVVIGFGTINQGSKKVVVNGDDFTIRGGHSDGSIYRKSLYAEQLAREHRIPMIRLLDGSSGGMYIHESINIHNILRVH